jgi:hypothetical protein
MDVSGLYWRTHRLVGALCPPGLLVLDAGRLSFTTANARVFDVPVDEVTGRLTAWRTLVLEVGGAGHPLLESAGTYQTPFTKTQRHVVGAARSSRSLRRIDEWPALLRAAGATVRSPRLLIALPH